MAQGGSPPGSVKGHRQVSPSTELGVEDSRNDKRPQFGERTLADPSQVFKHNAWDNVQWGSEQEMEAEAKVNSNSSVRVSEEESERYERQCGQYWDKFYGIHQNRFFKDRHWLFTEFPELCVSASVVDGIGNAPANLRVVQEASSSHHVSASAGDCVSSSPEHEHVLVQSLLKSDEHNCTLEGSQRLRPSYPGSKATLRFFEVGCGVGNTIYPIIETNNHPGLFVYGCDISDRAVSIVKEHSLYNSSQCHAFVCDVASDTEPLFPMPDSSLDIITLIFVLSAISPSRMGTVIQRLSRLLRPGGKILFRDYGRYDLAQLRFKNGQCISDNFYVRGDGTRAYFFTQAELKHLFTKEGLLEDSNMVDRRLQVNRGRQLKMYRVWIQGKYIKPNS